MHYYYLRLLSIIKSLIGGVMTKIASLYNYLTYKINSGIKKQEDKIFDERDKTIEDAKLQVVLAAQRVLELEAEEAEIAISAVDTATTKLNTLNAKVK